jgi:hypothetical protein
MYGGTMILFNSSISISKLALLDALNRYLDQELKDPVEVTDFEATGYPCVYTIKFAPKENKDV